MEFSRLILEKMDSVARITLNRPDLLNAVDTELLRDLNTALNEIERDDALRAAVITGRGRAFCAGADLKHLMGIIISSQRTLAFLRLFHTTMNHIENLPRPTIAAVNGMALAGGLEIVLACDLALAASEARLGDQHANFGLVAGGGGTQRLPRLIGARRAKELLLSGDWVSAQEAERIGLVNRVVPPDKLEEESLALARKLAERSPQASRTVKELVKQGLDIDLPAALEMEINKVALHFTTEDSMEGMKAFEEKRKPHFSGK